MMYRSGDNLQEGAISFIANNEEITIFSAYLTLNALKELNAKGKIVQIVVRWEIQDLCKGVSDIDLYDYCLVNKIALYRNTRIHLKAFWNNKRSVFFGSANLTAKGIGEKGNYNLELNGKIDNISFEDQSYLNKIILESEYVSEELYNEIKERVDNFEHILPDFPELPTPQPTVDYFLINQLPMTSTPDLLYSIYTGNNADKIEMNCAAHDLELYNIQAGFNEEEFRTKLGSSFNNHPFILAFKEAVRNSEDDRGRADRNGSMRFGAVRAWFANHTTTVPTPRSYELNEYVSLLYNWICYFDHEFTWERFNHTQVICWKESH